MAKVRILRPVSIAAALAIWQAMSMVFPPQIVPGPTITFASLYSNFVDGALFSNLLDTTRRVLLGFGIALILGVATGVGIGLRGKVDDLLNYPILILLSLPSPVLAILSLMWFGLTESAAVFVATSIVFPLIVINVAEGVRSIDKSLVEMARVYGSSSGKVVLDVVLPSIVPYIIAASRFSLGVAFKISVITEMFGVPSGVGFQIQYYYSIFRMDQVLAWTLVFTLVILLVDTVVMKGLEKRLMAWRPTIAV